MTKLTCLAMLLLSTQAISATKSTPEYNQFGDATYSNSQPINYDESYFTSRAQQNIAPTTSLSETLATSTTSELEPTRINTN